MEFRGGADLAAKRKPGETARPSGALSTAPGPRAGRATGKQAFPGKRQVWPQLARLHQELPKY